MKRLDDADYRQSDDASRSPAKARTRKHAMFDASLGEVLTAA